MGGESPRASNVPRVDSFLGPMTRTVVLRRVGEEET